MSARSLLLVMKGAIVAVWVALIVFVACGSITEMPLSAGVATRTRLVSILPEGWAFFTRDPRESSKSVYLRENGHWVRHSQAQSRVWLGLKRNDRVEGAEIEKLMSLVPASKHFKCEGSLDACLANPKLPVARVVNPMLVRSLAGEVVIASAQPVPWAWSAARDRVYMPSDVVKLNVIWK